MRNLVDRLEELKGKYQAVLAAISQNGVRLDHLHIQDNKLFMQGGAPNDAIKNAIWDKIKGIDPTYSDLICNEKSIIHPGDQLVIPAA
jgi:hypothetical protein